MLEMEDNLLAEIEFWRDLITDRNDQCPQETLERMQQALALAQKKLHLLRLEVAPLLEESQLNFGKGH